MAQYLDHTIDEILFGGTAIGPVKASLVFETPQLQWYCDRLYTDDGTRIDDKPEWQGLVRAVNDWCDNHEDYLEELRIARAAA